MTLVGGEEARIIASDRPDVLPSGTTLSSLGKDYIVIGKSFFDWGASDLTLQLMTFMSNRQFKKINDAIVVTERAQRAAIALALSVSFALIIYWITWHLQRITNMILDVSRDKLNIEPRIAGKGDELHILENQFRNFTEEILESRDQLKKQAEELLREKTVYLDNVLHSSTMAIAATDVDFRIKYFNSAAEKLFGCGAHEVIGKTVAEMHVCRAINTERLEKAVATIQTEGEYHNTFEQNHGAAGRFLEFKISKISGNDNTLIGYMLMAQDITERKRTEDKMRLDAVVFSNTSEGIMITDKDSIIQSVNNAFEKITGYSAEEAVGLNPRILQSGRHDELFFKELWKTLQDHGLWEGILWNKRKNGEIYPQETVMNAIKDKNGAIVQYVALFSDITTRSEAEEVLRNLSNRDGLTGLANRRAFDDFFREEWRRGQREGYQLSILMIDVDFFKKYNDTYGHLRGDECLRQIAGALQKFSRRPGEIAARFGGEEFVVICIQGGPAEGHSVCGENLQGD